MTNKEKSEIQDAIIASLPVPVHGLLQLAPRLGKSRIAINIMKEQKPKSILWVTPTADLRDKAIPSEYESWKAKRYLAKSTIICWGSLAGVEGHFDLVILDEYQDTTPNNMDPFFTGQITYGNIIGLSGTHPTHEEKNEIYKKLNLKPLANLDIDEAVGRGIIADYNITVVEVKMEDREKLYQGGSKVKPFMQSEKSRYVYLSRLVRQAMYDKRRKDGKFKVLNRMRFVYNSKSKEKALQWLFDKLEGRTIAFCGGIDQAERISDHTYHSKTDSKDMDKFLAGELEKIACVNAGGVGFTYKDVDNFLIGQTDSDKKGLSSQKITRSMLEQGEDYKANILILCLLDSQDEKWVESTLQRFDMSKVTRVRFDDLLTGSKEL